MRKYMLILILLFVILFFFKIDKVKAQILYDIREFNVTESNVLIRGQAMRRYNNNYPGRYTKVYVVAKSKTSGKNLEKAVSLDSSIVLNTSDGYYGLRCIRRGSGCYPENSASAFCANGDCIIRNIDFKVTFTIEELKKLGSNVNFYIRIGSNPSLSKQPNSIVLKRSSVPITEWEDVAIGVYYEDCKIGGKTCIVGKNQLRNDNSDLNIELEDIGDTIKIAANPAYVLQGVNTKYGYGYKDPSCGKYKDGQTAKVKSRFVGPFTRFSEKYYIYGIRGYKINLSSSNAASSCLKYKEGLIPALWTQVNGVITLKFDDSVSPPQCSTDDIKELTCNNTGFEYSCERTVSVEVKATHSETGTVSGKTKTCSGVGRDTISATYQMNQTGDLTFNLDRGPVYSGGSFTFSVSYLNYAIWYYTDRIDECPLIKVPNSVVKTCGGGCKKRDENGKCVSRNPKYPCCKDGSFYSSDCPQGSNRNRYLYESEIAKTYNSTKITKSDNMKVTMPDSNTVGGNKNTSPGEWKCGNTEALTRWGPNEPMYLLCTYELKNAYVNRTTSVVSYGNINNSNGAYLSEGKKYFVPLKWGNNGFEVSAEFKNLSAFEYIKWSGTYKCDVECQQRLFNNIPDDGEDVPSGYTHNNTPGLYLYMYRPISLSDPFPNNRQAGFNWHKWLDENKKNRLKNTYNENNIEYTVSLTNANISTIKDYNDTQLNNKGYMNNSIELNGLSKFINTYGFVKRTNADYYALGKGVYSR